MRWHLAIILPEGQYIFIHVVSWTRGLRYRPNRKQCRESRGIVGYINVSSVLFKWKVSWKGPAWPWPRAFRDTCLEWREKTKETLKTVLVEKPERTDTKGVQSVNWEARASECRSRRVWIGKSEAVYENKTYDSIVIISLLRTLFIKSKHHYLSFPLRPIKILHIYIVAINNDSFVFLNRFLSLNWI